MPSRAAGLAVGAHAGSQTRLASELAFHRSRVARGIFQCRCAGTRGSISGSLAGSADAPAPDLISSIEDKSSRVLLLFAYTVRPACGLFHRSRPVKIQLLPSTFDGQGHATLEQRLTCYLIDDCVAVDAGSIAIALTHGTTRQRCGTLLLRILTWTTLPVCRFLSTIFTQH